MKVLDRGELELMSPPIGGYGDARIIRGIRLAAEGSELTVSTRLEFPAHAAATRPIDREAICPWQVTQTAAPDLLLVHVPAGAGAVSAQPRRSWSAKAVGSDGDVLLLEPKGPAQQSKVLTGGDVLANRLGDTLFVQQLVSADGAGTTAAAMGAIRCQAYLDVQSAKAADHYLEMEWAGTGDLPGDAVAGLRVRGLAVRGLAVRWSLQRLSPGARGAAEIAAMLARR